MSGINLYNDQPGTDTAVPNVFIDEYMTRANGEYVKIYLYMLRCTGQHMPQFSLSKAADHFDCTEKDVLRALRYWEKLSLFGLEYDDGGNLCGVRFLSGKPGSPVGKAPEGNASEDLIESTKAASKEKCSPERMNELKEREDVREMLFITEQYTGRTLNQTDLSIIFGWYDELGMSADLIEFIIESCVAKGHKSLYYMDRVARDYRDRGIKTAKEARATAGSDALLYSAVMKAFGIRGRNLADAELSFLRKWSREMGFSNELIAEACRRTICAIHEPGFKYADSILKSWEESGIRTMDDVKKADIARKKNPEGVREKSHKSQTSNKFINFKQRENNYEELQRKLLQSSAKPTAQ